MRVLVFVLGLLTGGPAVAQEFASPLDVVKTLYDSYLLDAPLGDISPYFSDNLTARLEGLRIGSAQFKEVGMDPVTGFLDWRPRDLTLSLLRQSGNFAQVRVSFKQDNVAANITLDVLHEPAHGWQISHIAGEAGAESWCTNAIVAIADRTRAASLAKS